MTTAEPSETIARASGASGRAAAASQVPARRTPLPAVLAWCLTLLATLARGVTACQPPYATLPGGLTWQVPSGAVREFAAGLVVAAGETALLAGTARVTGGVTIRGSLYLSSNSSSLLSADWIAVEGGGRLQAGSATCPLPAGVTATLLLNGGAAHPQAGRKALAVLAGGTLEASSCRLVVAKNQLQHPLPSTVSCLHPPSVPPHRLTQHLPSLAAPRQQRPPCPMGAPCGHRPRWRRDPAARRRRGCCRVGPGGPAGPGLH